MYELYIPYCWKTLMSIVEKIGQSILRQIKHIDTILGVQEWKIDEPLETDEELSFCIVSPFLSESQIESLEHSYIQGMFWKSTIFESDGVHIDVYCDTQYWISIYIPEKIEGIGNRTDISRDLTSVLKLK